MKKLSIYGFSLQVHESSFTSVTMTVMIIVLLTPWFKTSACKMRIQETNKQ